MSTTRKRPETRSETNREKHTDRPGDLRHAGSLSWYLEKAPPTADLQTVRAAWIEGADPEEVWPETQAGDGGGA